MSAPLKPHQRELPARPKDDDMLVDVLFRNGEESRGKPVRHWHWQGHPHGPGYHDIVDWRPA